MTNLYPHFLLRHVCEITPAFLQEQGIQAIICDLDNTLVPWHSEEIPPDITVWLEALAAQNISICLASNTHNLSRLSRVAQKMGVLYVAENSRKPSLYGVQKALAQLQSSPQATLMVGDQLFTDMVAGNKLGVKTVLINPLTTHEFIGTKLISRTAERFVLRGKWARPL